MLPRGLLDDIRNGVKLRASRTFISMVDESTRRGGFGFSIRGQSKVNFGGWTWGRLGEVRGALWGIGFEDPMRTESFISSKPDS